MKKIEIKNLSKKYGKRYVLDDLNFYINDGEFLSLLGPSGCGKTTLLRILMGIEQPTIGQVYKDGIDITKTFPKERNMGFVFQNYALFPNMNVYNNIAYALKTRHFNKDVIKKKVLDVVEKVGLKDQLFKKPSKMSGGQQQRVAIARTLVLEPDVIMFDEPMAALDAEIRMNLRGELKELQKELGVTMIYVTHDQEEAFSLSDRIAIINDNKIIQIDTPSNIYNKPANEYVKKFVVDQLNKKVNSIITTTKA